LYLGISSAISRSQISTNSFFHIEIEVRFNLPIDMISMHNYLKARGAVREKMLSDKHEKFNIIYTGIGLQL
jgi:hypothetical protein